MTSFIYAQSREDFYFKQASEAEYAQQFDKLISQPNNLYLGFSEEKGFIYP